MQLAHSPHPACLRQPRLAASRCPAAAVAPRLRDGRQQARSRAVTQAASSDYTELQRALQRKEAELASLFQTGATMPQASLVARLRSEIAALEDQLAGRPVTPLVQPGPVATGFGPAPSRSAYGGGGPPPMMPPPPGMSEPLRTRTEELAAKAYDMVEQEMRQGQGGGAKDDLEMAQLEAENSALRAQAYSLLQRQQQLETLVAEAQGQKEPELLLSTTEDLLASMRKKLAKAQAAGGETGSAEAGGAEAQQGAP